MARRRGHPAEFSTSTSFGHEAKDDAIFRMEEKNWTGKSSLAGTNNTTTMPLTQEKNMEYSFSNNNDHNYLHKKFKKVASTVPVSTCSAANSSETRNKQTSIETEANHSVTSQSIAGSHTVIEKKKEKTVYQENLSLDIKGNVQTNFSYNNSRISDVNNLDQNTGKTSFSEEFLNKTEPIDDELLRDIKNGTSGRYVCPYCKISCAKPSVLQKHIRAHTNERPYPCVPCGFAFKTKSNLFKHRRSRTHALRLQGADVAITNEDELSAGSESDASLPPTSASDTGSEVYVIRPESSRPSEFSSPELANDRVSPSTNESTRLKGIYKPKFRAAFFQESDECDLNRKFSANADFLNEHIAKIISENEAIVDVIETPLQKKYGKIKQIAESKQLNQNDTLENKTESAPLNLTKNGQDNESFFRKRSRSENFTQFDPHKHPLNPEGSIIKDLLLKTKVNGLNTISTEPVDGTLVVCPLCQIPYRSAENLEIHRMYYCKGMVSNNIQIQKDVKSPRPENIFMRSNSINVRLPETPTNSVHRLNPQTKSPPLRNNKPDNLVIIKPETNDIIAPLPSPGPLLGNTRLVDSRLPSDGFRKQENYKLKPIASPKRRFDSRSETYSPRLIDNSSPRSTETYPPSKVRCIETNSATPRSLDDISQHMRNNSTSLQMFGGEVKIVDQSGSTTTLRIEPSKNQLSPIVIHQSISPYKLSAESETSNVVVRSGLHSGGTIVQNSTPQTPRITISPAVSVQTSNMHEIPHFQFPPLSAITAFNPLTLPPLTSTPNGASTIYHGGKLIPHVPGIPGPNTPAMYVAAPSVQYKNVSSNEVRVHHMEEVQKHGKFLAVQNNRGQSGSKYDTGRNSRSPNSRMPQVDFDNQRQTSRIHDAVNKLHNLPIIRIKNVDEVSSVTLKSYTPNNIKPTVSRHELPFKRGIDGLARTPVLKENLNFLINKTKPNEKHNLNKITETKASDIEVQNFNFETLITKAEIFNNQIPSSSEVQKNTNAQEMPVVSSINERSEPLYFQKNVCTKNGVEDKKPKFLRPSTLPLKPGTFTPKKHHGITPNANTMPLVSPETPRPAKAYGQLYLNGNAYTYLGLKCSTKVFYCTINRPQPTYVPNQHFLSMYSNWQLLSELTPDPLGLSASSAMALYDSRHRPQSMTIATIKQDLILTHSSQWNKQYTDGKLMSLAFDAKKAEENRLTLADGTLAPKKELTGGFESNEEYTYIRGRGRGRYVCSECGIRCKKPSMLKKHIRTHTDVRPYTCTHCSFSFKTKGNLTKHMKSKAHYKKCCELGINPTEGTDMDGTDTAQCSGETDDESDSDGDEGNEGETESSDTEACKSRLPEHEAAHSLLSLGCSRPATAATPGLITSARPTTYPYTPSSLESPSAERTPETMSIARSLSTDTRIDVENEPMDLSKTETKSPVNITEIPTARESSVLASLASNTAKLPTPQAQWSNGEPMLHAYLTERALFDSKIKQSQLTGNMSKLKNAKAEDDKFEEERQLPVMNSNVVAVASQSKDNSHKPTTSNDSSKTHSKVEEPAKPVPIQETAVSVTDTNKLRGEGNAENAKLVVSEYLKLARINSNTDNVQNQTENSKEANKHTKANAETGKVDDSWFMPDDSDSESIKLPMTDHDPVARKVVIGAGGVAFKVTKGKEFENASSYSPGRLMEDGRRVCDFCSKTFTKPSQLRLHLNIHYMERPFRCSACAVSFRTRGHLQKHERSGSHHNKVSMTSTFGAATSLNPRPFRCSDCNIAFRIHGHLAKHLRSKMHVMRLECLFKLPFGTFTEIERAGVSLTDIDTTDCASSLSSLQVLARKLHEKDPSKLEYRDPPPATVPSTSAGRESSDDEEGTPFLEKTSDSERDSDIRTSENSERHDKETRVIFSATDI